MKSFEKVACFAVDEEDLSIADCLLRACGELRDTEAHLAKFESLVCDLISTAANPDNRSIADLQSVDHIRQTILGVASFLESIGDSCGAGWKIDASKASAAVTLHNLAARLRKGCVVTQNHDQPPDRGYHLFDD